MYNCFITSRHSASLFITLRHPCTYTGKRGPHVFCLLSLCITLYHFVSLRITLHNFLSLCITHAHLRKTREPRFFAITSHRFVSLCIASHRFVSASVHSPPHPRLDWPGENHGQRAGNQPKRASDNKKRCCINRYRLRSIDIN